MSPCPWQPLHGWDTTNRPELAVGTPLFGSSLDAIGILLITAIIHVSAQRTGVQRRAPEGAKRPNKPVCCNALLGSEERLTAPDVSSIAEIAPPTRQSLTFEWRRSRR